MAVQLQPSAWWFMGGGDETDILEKVQQVGDGFSLAIGEDVVIVDFAATCTEKTHKSTKRAAEARRLLAVHTRATVEDVGAEVPEGSHGPGRPLGVSGKNKSETRM